jgi:hypothetical protein
MGGNGSVGGGSGGIGPGGGSGHGSGGSAGTFGMADFTAQWCLPGPRASSAAFEELNCTFVLLCSRSCVEGSKIPSPVSLRIGPSRIQAVLAGMELANHRVLPLAHFCGAGRQRRALIS